MSKEFFCDGCKRGFPCGQIDPIIFELFTETECFYLALCRSCLDQISACLHKRNQKRLTT